MRNNFDISYAAGSIILVTLGSLSLWQLARLVPALLDALQIICLVLAAIPLALILLSGKRETLSLWLFVWFLVGLGGIFAWT